MLHIAKQGSHTNSNRSGKGEHHSDFGASALPGLLTPSGRTAAEAALCKHHYTKFAACYPLCCKLLSACKLQYTGLFKQLQQYASANSGAVTGQALSYPSSVYGC